MRSLFYLVKAESASNSDWRTSGQTKEKESLGVQLKRDGQFEDKQQDDDELFEMVDCCRPCITLFEVDVPKSNPAYVPMKVSAQLQYHRYIDKGL